MLERVLAFSLRQRGFVVVVTLALAALGVNALLRLPIDAVPDITNNQVQVNTAYHALSPVEIEKQVTFPIETALVGMPGLEYTRSLSRNGFSQVVAVFTDATDVYFARQQVSERLAEARQSLPPGAEPSLGPISTGLGEVFMWAVEFTEGERELAATGEAGWQASGAYLTPEGELLTSELEQATYLREVQDWIVRPQVKGVAGVAGVDAIGGYVKQYHVQPDPRRLVAYGLTFGDVLEALERNNVSTGAGYIEHNGEAYLVRAAGRLETPEQIGAIVAGESAGTPIYVRDIAHVGIGRELRTGSATEAGREVVIGTAMMLIGENSRTVAAAVAARIEEVNRSLPPGIRARPVLDRTKLVDATIATVRRNLFEGAVLVVAVLFVFLGNLRAALITALAIPLSMLFTAIGMVETRTSGNLMSLGAIDFGLIVDGAVIIVENSLRRLAERQRELGRVLTLHERIAVTQSASRQVLRPAAFGVGIIATVYVPVLFLTGVEGKMFRPMALTVIFALAAAFVLSLTLVPALVALLLRGRIVEREGRVLVAAKRAYAPALAAALRFRFATVGVALALFAGSLGLFTRLGQEFAPVLSELDVLLQAIRIPSTSLTQATAMQRDLERAISTVPEVALVFSKTGTAEVASDPMPPNISDTFVILKPRAEWPNPRDTKDDVALRIEGIARALPGNNYELTQPIEMRFNELIAGVRGDVAVKVFGDDFELLLPVAERIAGEFRETRGATDVRVEQIEGLPTLDIEVDRAAIARLGLSVADVHDVIGAAVGGREAGELFRGDRRFDIVLRLPEAFRRSTVALENLPIPLGRHEEEVAHSRSLGSARDAMDFSFVPLGSVARVHAAEGPNQVSRENGKRRIVVQANVRGRDIGSFVEALEPRVAKVKLPPGVWLEWGGQFENLALAKQRLAIVVPLCFAVIFGLLYSTFRSASFALLVFSGVPLGLSGGIVALWLRDMPFSISAAVGFIALSGVAVLNGLVLVTFINELRAAGRTLDDALFEGCLVRLRPVLMTALVASLGFVPMALATGTGAEVQRPLATVVIGGLLSSTLLTLLVLPALYRIAAPRLPSVEQDEATTSEPAQATGV